MVDKTDQAEKLRAAQEYFRGLGIDGWVETNSPVLGGGQATILVVEREDGARGAFRFTTETDEQALERFFREIKILSEYEHPNIIKILDYSKDKTKPWYISELGGPFQAYWKSRREQLVNDPEQLIRSAVDVVRQLADGLARLHSRGIVHRDIKPANIIVSISDDGSKRPVLIDFGLAYVESEPRLSDVNEAVGNLRFSPDVAMYRMDDVPPWLDVHNLAQLFMWMTRVRPDKDWQRALDWRWVNYDEKLSEDSVLSIRALTAQCSEQTISPKDARELINLIDKLFPQTQPSSPATINISQIEEGRRRGIAASELALAEDARIIEASFPIVAKSYLALLQGFDSLFAACSAAGLRVKKVLDQEVDTFRVQLLNATTISTDVALVEWEVGDDTGNAFRFSVRINGIVPSRRSELLAGGGQVPSESSNPFYFYLYLYGIQGRSFPSKTRFLTLDDQGSLLVRDSIISNATAVAISDIVEMVKGWIEDPAVWEALHKFK